jgi:hypothetical protein
LLLALHGLHEFFESAKAGLDLVERVVERLNLAGDLIDLRTLRLLLGLHLLLQCAQIGRHLVDGVGALLDEALQDAHTFVVGLLQTGESILQLLDLGLKLHHIFADGEGRRGAEDGGSEDRSTGETERWDVEVKPV